MTDFKGQGEDVVIPEHKAALFLSELLLKEIDRSCWIRNNSDPGRSVVESWVGEKVPDILFTIVGMVEIILFGFDGHFMPISTVW